MVKSRDVSSRRGKDHRYTINNTLQLRTLMLNFAVITFFFFIFRPDWNLHRRVYLFWVAMKEKGISVVNFSTLICLHVDICLVNPWHAVFNRSSIHVRGQVRGPREVSSVCVLWLLIISKQDLFHEDFQMPSHFIYFLNSLCNELVDPLDGILIKGLRYSSDL